jgi:hypothetical protein
MPELWFNLGEITAKIRLKTNSSFKAILWLNLTSGATTLRQEPRGLRHADMARCAAAISLHFSSPLGRSNMD